jgi:hypothetical protein
MTATLTITKTGIYLRRAVAHAVAPVLRISGVRFSKAWRGNFIVDHVAANVLADGGEPFALSSLRF